MLRNLCQLEYIMENKVCRLLCDNDMPLVLIKEALFQFQKYVGHIEDQVKAQQEEGKVKEPTNIAPDAIDPPSHELNEENQNV